MYIFSMENPFFRFVGRCVDLVWINLLTLLCCIPVVTAGAALSAMYQVLLPMVMHEEGGITKAYFQAFRDNFKSATRVYVPILFGMAILLGNAYLLKEGNYQSMGKLFFVMAVSIGILFGGLLLFLHYDMALLARYDADWKQTANNAFRLMVAFLPRSLCMLVILASPIALMLLSDYFLWFWFLYGISVPCYFVAMLLGKIFKSVEARS